MACKKGVKMIGSAQLPLTEIHTLEECCLIEEKCAHIYRHFSKVFSISHQICSFWDKIASEEDHHANTFRLAIGKLKPGMSDVNPCNKQLDKIMNSLESIHQKVETKHPTLIEAFELALYIEKTLAEFHIDSVVKYSDSQIADLFLQMEKNDQGHLELLQDTVKSLC
jgi:rubrerythrin